MDYGRVMTALRRRRWMIALCVVGCTGLTALGSTRMKKEYLASATLMPQEQALTDIRDLAKPVEASAERDDLTAKQDRIKTVSSILTSPAVVGPVIEQQRLNLAPTRFLDRVEVKEPTSQVLTVTYRDEDPRRAAATINAMVDQLLAEYSRIRSSEAGKQVGALEQEERKAQADLQQASAKLESFKRSRRITSLPDQMRTALEQTRTLTEARNTAEAALREASAQLASVSDQLARTPETREVKEAATQTTLVDKMKLDLAELRGKLSQELAQHTEEHPNVKRLQQQIAEQESRINTASTQMATTTHVIRNPDRDLLVAKQRDLRNQRDGLQARVARLTSDLDRMQSQSAGFSGKDVELGLLAQHYSLAEARLNTVSTRLGQVRNVAQLLSSGSPIAVVDRAGPLNPPYDLSQGRMVRLSALAFVMSLAVCIALAIGLEMADRRVRSIEDAETLTRLPVVSVVPQLPGRSTAGSLCLTAENDPSSHLAESYHFLANHIFRQTLRRQSTVLMAATARPGQGATTALSNLAIALARAGRQVVLVEADLRRPFLHQVFETGDRPGLTDVLSGHVPLAEALSETHVKNLRLLPGGSTARDPWSLLWQPSMAQLVQDLRDTVDYVIFNVPSATVFADALCVAPHVDGAVLVMRTSEMPNGAEQKVREWLEEVNVPVMGVVLNGVPARDMESFEFHRSYTARRADETAPALGAPATAPVRRPA